MGVRLPEPTAGVEGIDTDKAEGVTGPAGAPLNEPNPVEISNGFRRREGGRFTFCKSIPELLADECAMPPPL